MFVLIDKEKKISYLSTSKKEISKASGLGKARLDYYARLKFKGYYENSKVIFIKSNVLKSKQGGKRIRKIDWR